MARKYVLWIALLCLLLAGSANVSARTITVGHTTDADYWTIQEAVNAANLSGDTIQVMVGTYSENVDIPKSLVLQSDEKDRTIIAGRIVVKATTDNVTIRGFTIQDGHEGIQISGNNSTVTDNIIRNIYSKGIYLSSSTGNTISSNVIEDVRTGSPNGDPAYGIYLASSTGNTISGNIIRNIYARRSSAYGIYLSSSTGNTISSNTIERVNNNIIDGEYHIYLQHSSSNILTNNTIGSSTICDYGLCLTSTSTMNHIYHNNILNSTHNGYDNSGNNGWDNGQTSGGNYWSDYMGNDTDGDGIGDTTPYYISGGMDARDNYPFMEKNGWMDVNVTPTPPVDLIPATDSDGDGVPNVWDADNSTQEGYWVNQWGIGRRWGDMNGDGVLTSADALMILQAAAGGIEIG